MRPLQYETAVSVAFAFGRVVQMTPDCRPDGLLSELASELSARGVLPDLLSRMEPGYADSLRTAIMLDRAAAARGARQRNRR